ncbi:hypothetical protein BS50DRAFT_186835 [Corynespora cassiicola Philippines]|uniref:CENP-V/GFA domain-containing protein n=1 Tax=Corynespora cassiicola Philippines TaxID=1448308 RepID=A0A2T2P6X5_CORCC|nr:hypothetical protein BS50DRAFT_186835 [Corynespora cassiicola Philippines]
MAQEGGCFCGNVRYSVEGEPVKKALCHCRDCRKISGSAYSTNAIYPESAFKRVKGEAKSLAVKSDSGNEITSYFCGDCGSTMWREGKTFSGLVIIKVGTLDADDALENAKPVAELFVPCRPSWVAPIEGAAQAQAMS